ncbi:hypothetical protein T484DRAFT_3556773 [Baffinella frigidus]|nr:hypothetical protein T484DRAFT_3556773 [Cryptophyta sp. CCMP2293]
MRILTASLLVYVRVSENLAPETYTRVLQGKETLRDIREWATNCALSIKPSTKERAALLSLRFLTDSGEYITLPEEPSDPASSFLPSVQLVPVSKDHPACGTPADRKFIEDFLFKDPLQKTHDYVPHRPGYAGSGGGNNAVKGPTTPPRDRPRSGVRVVGYPSREHTRSLPATPRMMSSLDVVMAPPDDWDEQGGNRHTNSPGGWSGGAASPDGGAPPAKKRPTSALPISRTLQAIHQASLREQQHLASRRPASAREPTTSRSQHDPTTSGRDQVTSGNADAAGRIAPILRHPPGGTRALEFAWEGEGAEGGGGVRPYAPPEKDEVARRPLYRPSPRQLRVLSARVEEYSDKALEAVRTQIYHGPGRSREAGARRVQTALLKDGALSKVELDGSGRVVWDSIVKVPHFREGGGGNVAWRPSSGTTRQIGALHGERFELEGLARDRVWGRHGSSSLVTSRAGNWVGVTRQLEGCAATYGIVRQLEWCAAT